MPEKKNRPCQFYMPQFKQQLVEDLTAAIIDIFQASRNNYGTRKIKQELLKKDMTVSRRRIGRIMKQERLGSNYTTAQFRTKGYV